MCKFKKGQTILVRNRDMDAWQQAVFHSQLPDDRAFRYYAGKYHFYDQAIPMEGNAHLKETRFSPKIDDIASYVFGEELYYYSEGAEDWNIGVFCKKVKDEKGRDTLRILTRNGAVEDFLPAFVRRKGDKSPFIFRRDFEEPCKSEDMEPCTR